MAKGTIGERIYRMLLRIYPRDFSDDYADEMTRLYRDRVRGEGAASVWLALVADLARTAPREQAATLVQDLRHAWRTWVRTPVLALTAILTLALGVGANTAVFSVVHAVLLRPLPYPDADRLVELFEHDRRGDGRFFRVSLLNYLSWVERARSFDALATFSGRDFIVTEHGDPERIVGSAVTASLFTVLGVAPIVGRPLTRDDEQSGAPSVAVLAESLWVHGFGRDPAVVGRSITLNGTRHQIIGIVPTTFREVGRTQIGAATAAQIFVPLTMNTAQSRSNHTLRVVGRLRPQVSLDQARDEMQRLAAGMEEEFPATNRHWGVSDRATPRLDVRPSRPRVAPGPAWRGWRRAPYRLRERRQSAPRTRHEPSARIRVAHGARRAARPSGATTAHRERLAGDGQWRLWSHGSHLLDAGVAHPGPGDDSAHR